jgi:hypothetical protein
MRSEAIDSLLYLFSAEGEYLTEDDDGGDGEMVYGAQILYTIPTDGQYIIYANQWFTSEAGGSYTLSLERN